MNRDTIGVATKKYQSTVDWIFVGIALVLAVYFLLLSPGQSADPMLTPLGSRLDYMVTRPAVIFYLALLYAWGVWLTLFTSPRKEVMVGLATILSGIGLWLWAAGLARTVGMVLLSLGLAYGVVTIGLALHHSSRQSGRI